MDKRYLTAFLNPPKYVIGGIELDFFCPRHFITLQAINSPFLNPQRLERLTFKDLFFAMRICSTESWTDAVKQPSFPDKIRYSIIQGIIQKQVSAYKLFANYLSESMTIPKLWQKEQDSQSSPKKPTNLPETLTIVTLLITKMGFSEKEAWDMPFSKAIWYSTAYAIQEGAEIGIITTSEEESEQSDLKRLSEFEAKISESIKLRNNKK